MNLIAAAAQVEAAATEERCVLCSARAATPCLGSQLAELLMDIVRQRPYGQDDARPHSAMSFFDAAKRVEMPIGEYWHRLVQTSAYTQVSAQALFHGAVLVCRLARVAFAIDPQPLARYIACGGVDNYGPCTGELYVSERSIHRLLAASVWIASKLHDDAHCERLMAERYAHAAGIPKKELLGLEVQLFMLVHAHLWVRGGDFDHKLAQLVSEPNVAHADDVCMEEIVEEAKQCASSASSSNRHFDRNAPAAGSDEDVLARAHKEAAAIETPDGPYIYTPLPRDGCCMFVRHEREPHKVIWHVCARANVASSSSSNQPT